MGFISKLLFSQAAVQGNLKMLPALIVLAISTVLNAIYFMKTVIRIYTPIQSRYASVLAKENPLYTFTLLCFVVLNIVLGMCSQPITDWITQGLSVFA